jgi:hypothetical protein
MDSPLDNFLSVPSPEAPARGEALCRLCAREQGGCCRTQPQLTYLSFPLSLPEWRRLDPYRRLAASSAPGNAQAFARAGESSRLLHDHPGLFPDVAQEETFPPPGGDVVCAQEENRPDFVASMRALFPGQHKRISRLFPEKGQHWSLRTRADGSCVFVDSEGCRLPRRARPWYCLLYPAWVTGGSLTLFSSPDCLISQKARGPAHGIELMRVSAGLVRMLHAGLTKDWGLE